MKLHLEAIIDILSLLSAHDKKLLKQVHLIVLVAWVFGFAQTT